MAKSEAAASLSKSPRDMQSIFEGKLKSVQESLKVSIETNQSLNKSERAKIIGYASRNFSYVYLCQFFCYGIVIPL